MKSIKYFLASLSVLVLALQSGYATSVDVDQARNTGFNFMKSKIKNRTISDAGELSLAYVAKNAANVNDFYVFNTPTGFVIVSGDDAVKPILAYSDESFFTPDKISPATRYLLNGYASQIESVVAAGTEATEETKGKWAALNTTTASHSTARTTSVVVAPLLGSIMWNQAPYYNDSCPNDATGGGRSVTGCVATATAQVMRFWKWPASGVGSHSYTTSTRGFSCSANFNHTYNWSFMPVGIAGHNYAIAQLMWNVGVAVNMDYTASASGAYVISGATGTPPYCAQYALTHFFRYDASLIKGFSRSSYSDASWLTLIKNDLSSGLPVIYSGYGSDGGHCWVLDGYTDTLGTNYFHCNWGWSGSGPNGYYSVDNMNPPALGTGGGAGGFINGQTAIFGIKPFMNQISGGLSICTGATTNLTNSTPGGVWLIDSTSVATIDSNGLVTGVGSGTATVTYKIGNVKVTSVVTVNVAPSAPTLSGPDYVCVGRTPAGITASTPGGTWSATNGNVHVLSGAVTAVSSGLDTVVYTLSNSCGTAADSLTILVPSEWKCDSILQVSQNAVNSELKIFPNPNSGAFEIEISENVNHASVIITDMYGKVVFENNYGNNTTRIPVTLQGLPDGIYGVRVVADGQYNSAMITLKRE